MLVWRLGIEVCLLGWAWALARAVVWAEVGTGMELGLGLGLGRRLSATCGTVDYDKTIIITMK